MSKKKSDAWVMPAWMEQYRKLIHNTGGNTVEELVNGNADPFINLPLSTLQACVKSQVGLLMSLNDRGLLRWPRCPKCGDSHVQLWASNESAKVICPGCSWVFAIRPELAGLTGDPDPSQVSPFSVADFAQFFEAATNPSAPRPEAPGLGTQEVKVGWVNPELRTGGVEEIAREIAEKCAATIIGTDKFHRQKLVADFEPMIAAILQAHSLPSGAQVGWTEEQIEHLLIGIMGFDGTTSPSWREYIKNVLIPHYMPKLAAPKEEK